MPNQSVGPFAERYGAWALVAGASEGLGAAFADDLAARGMNLLLIARRGALLAEVANGLRERYGVEVRCLVRDLADAGLAVAVAEATADIEVGVLVYNAAFIPMGSFAELDAAAVERVVRVNALGPASLVHTFLPSMRERGRGGIDVVAAVAGAMPTPSYRRSIPRDMPGMLEPDVVARRTLDVLGKGPRVVTGLLNRLSAPSGAC